MESNPQTKAALEHVHSGDPIDRDVVLRNVPVRSGMAMAAVAIGVPAGLNTAGGIGSYEFLAANGIYVPAAAAVAVAGNYAIRRYRTFSDEKAQAVIREAAGEPVDVITSGSGRRRELVMRWYGLDDDTEASNVLGRSTHMLQFAREHGISGIMVSKEPFQELATAEKLDTYEATTALSDHKGLLFSTLYDIETPAEEVLHASLEEFAALIDEYEVAHQGSVMEALVRELNDPFLAGLYKVYSDKKSPAVLGRINSHLKQAIESSMGESHVTAVWMPDGSRQLQKMHAFGSIIKGGRAMNMHVGNDAMSGQQRLNFSGVDELGALVGSGSNDELLRAITDQDLKTLSKQQLQSGLYLLLQRSNEEIATFKSRQEEISGNATVVPFLERVDKDDVLEKSTTMHVVRSLLAAGSVGAFACTGFFAGNAMAELDSQVYTRDSVGFEAYAKERGEDPLTSRYDDENDEIVDSQLYKEYLEDSSSFGMDFMRAYGDAVSEFYDKDYAAQYAVSKFLIKDLNLEIVKQLFPSFQTSYESRLAADLAIEAPPDIYDRSEYNMGLGDVADGKNAVVYSIEPLTGESTEGYWYQKTYDRMSLVDGDERRESTVELFAADPPATPIEMPGNMDDILKTVPDFRVETPYIGISDNRNIRGASGHIVLPVKFGGSVVGARIVDKQDPSKEYYPAVTTNYNGSYQIDVDELNFGTEHSADMADDDSPIISKDMKEPVLQYWVKNGDDPEFAAHRERTGVVFTDSRGDFIPNSERIKTLDSEVEAIAQSVRKDLGLAEDASAEAVLQAISEGKLYAYEPLEYEDTELAVPQQESLQTAQALGKILAELETANCNIATVTMLLANIDRNQLQAATGFSEDGDGKLTQQESHAWTIDEAGDIIDPTPGELAPGVKKRTRIDTDKSRTDDVVGSGIIEKGALALLGGAITILAYRRRQSIRETSDMLRTKAVFAHPAMAATVDRISHDLYARPLATYVVSRSEAKTSSDTAAVFASRVPAGSNLRAQNAELSERFRRATLRINQAAIRRHVSKTD